MAVARSAAAARTLSGRSAPDGRGAHPHENEAMDEAMTEEQENRQSEVSLEEVVALCKRRGFIFPSSEIYGGVGSTYDYGHYGVLLRNNVKAEWWRSMLVERDDIVALDSAIIQHPRVWEASGHVGGFSDPIVDCKTCKKRFRADKL